MSGLKAVTSYHREALERAFLDLREELHDKTQELEFLKVRSEQAILDTARCAALTSIITSMALCVSKRRYRAANEIAVMALEDQ